MIYFSWKLMYGPWVLTGPEYFASSASKFLPLKGPPVDQPNFDLYYRWDIYR